jgi:hypothetical protein
MSRRALPRRGVLSKAALAVEIVVLYARARRVMGDDDLPKALEVMRDRRLRAGETVSLDEARATARAVTRTLRVIPLDTRCLAQSLVLAAALARRSTPSSVVIAVRPGNDFVAHAWVELDGEPLLPTGTPGFQRLASL